MLAYKRADVRNLNEIARAMLKDNGELKEGYIFSMSNGERELSQDDQVYF